VGDRRYVLTKYINILGEWTSAQQCRLVSVSLRIHAWPRLPSPALPNVRVLPPSSSADATGLLAGTGVELQAGSVFAETDEALESKLAKWVPLLVTDLDTVAALQSPQYTTLLEKTVRVSFLNTSDTVTVQGPPSLTNDPNTTFIDNEVKFPAEGATITFTNLL